jgi:WD40 repeat protein
MSLLEKLTFVDASPIHSLDLHPDQKRFAIAQVNEITIWSLPEKIRTKDFPAPDMNALLKFAKIVPKDFLLSKLQNHTQNINCVRWSADGKYLAAGSADHKVTIYHLTYGDGMYKENWTCHKILSNHSADVMAVAWSSKQNLLATASIDSTVNIYDGETFEKLRTLSHHDSWVRAISFDPIGTFFATQSDKSLIFYTVSNWEKKYEVTECFEKASEIPCLRQSWSTEGGLFVAPGGFLGRKNIAPIFGRNSLDHHVNELAGHKGGIAVVKFNPSMFTRENDQPFSYVAVGGHEGTLSVWSTEISKPIFTSTHMFTNGITDISWTHDGYGLLIASSMEKSLFHIILTKELLGNVISKKEMELKLMETYGDTSKNGYIPEDVSMLEVAKPVVVQKAIATISQPKVTVTEQKETVKNGKRRITPSSVTQTTPIDSMDIVVPQEVTHVPAPKREVIRVNFDDSTEPQIKKKKPDTLHATIRKKNEKSIIPLDANSEIVVKGKDIEYKHLGQLTWKKSFKDPLKYAVHNTFYVILVFCSSVNVYTPDGISILPPIQIAEPIAVFLNKTNFFCVLSKDGMCNVWNLDEKSSFIQASADFLDSHVDNLGLTEGGIPIITCSTAESFSYDLKLKSWICIAEVKTMLTPYLSSNVYDDVDEFSLKSLRQKALKVYPTLLEGGQHHQGSDSFEFLEKSIQTAVSMKNEGEFVGFCKSYASAIARFGSIPRFEHLWRILTGDEPELEKFNKKSLAKEVLQIVGFNKTMQKVVIDKKTQLNDL